MMATGFLTARQEEARARVRMARLDAEAKEQIIAARYHHERDTFLTTCTLILASGFTILGEASTVHSALFQEEKGRTLAFQNALGKLQAFQAYVLADQSAAMARSEA